MCSCLCDKRAVFEDRFQDLSAIFSESFIPLTLLLHCKHSLLAFKITGFKSPTLREHDTFKYLFNWIKLFKFLSLNRYIEITYLLAWERCFSQGRTMNVDEIRPIILWQALVIRTSFCVRTWGALSLIKFNYLVIWHCTNVINKSKKFLGLTVTVVCFRSICCRNCGF